MPNKKISELTSATPTSSSVLPASDSSGTVTNKITLQSILDLESRWDNFKPAAPTGVTPTAGNAQVSLSWTAPSGTLSAVPVTDYAVQYSSNSGSTWTTFSDGVSASTSATVTGLTAGTAYVFRVAATNAIGTGPYSTATSSVTPSGSYDQYFSNVSALLHMDGTGATFTESAKSRAVTANGQAAQTSAYYKFGGASAVFDGSGDWLGVAGVGNIGTSDFVLEWWMRASDVSAYQSIIGTNTGGNFMVALLAPYNGAGAIGVGRHNVAWDFVRNASLSNNTWHYVAISRDSGTMRLYVDGSIVGASSSNTQSYPIDTLQIGATQSGAAAGFAGHIDDLRLTIGSSRGYTGATIPVPTSAFPHGEDEYFSSVSALLHCDGTDGSQTFTDSSNYNATVTSNGTISLSTAQKQFGTASCLIDNGYFGAGYLQLPADARFNFGSGDFTVEFWIRFNSIAQDQRIAGGDMQMYSGYYNWAIYMPSSGALAYYLGSSGYSWDIAQGASVGSVSTNTWYHVVLQRSGNTFSPYLNGVRGTQTTSSAALYDNTSNGPFFGLQGSSAAYFYIDDIRITKGVARYSGATISVPAAAFPNN